MYRQITILILLLPAISCALNTTTTTTTTKRTTVVACTANGQCPSTHYCNALQHICVLKRPVNAACSGDVECSSGKCHENVCRRPCKHENDCSLTKEYCSRKKFCSAKHCSYCTRDAQCANNKCHFFYCVKSTCLSALAALQKQ